MNILYQQPLQTNTTVDSLGNYVGDAVQEYEDASSVGADTYIYVVK